jgi:hypothetical protein
MEAKKLSNEEFVRGLAQRTSKFVREHVEKELAPIREKQNSLADASRVAELTTQVGKLTQQVSSQNKTIDSLRRRLDQLCSTVSSK